MSSRNPYCYVVHDRDGRIHAIAPKTTMQLGNGYQLGWRPVPNRNQIISEVELDEEQAKLPLHELLQFKIKLDAPAGRALLQRKPTTRRP